jgi:hypothetical protein
MHCSFSEDPGDFAIKKDLKMLSLPDLLRGREEEGRGEVLAGYFCRELREGAGTKDDASGRCVIDEFFHCCFVRQIC